MELDRAAEALNAFLTALDLDPELADELTTYIATVSTFFCEIPPDVLKKIKGSIECAINDSCGILIYVPKSVAVSLHLFIYLSLFKPQPWLYYFF